jgi:cobalt-zinc-cadmium efflux system outer membrane protein
LQDALSALQAAYQQLLPARESVQLTYQLEVAERKRYAVGASDLFVVNFRELQTADAAALEVVALADYFAALADYQAAVGLDGLTASRYGITVAQ